MMTSVISHQQVAIQMISAFAPTALIVTMLADTGTIAIAIQNPKTIVALLGFSLVIMAPKFALISSAIAQITVAIIVMNRTVVINHLAASEPMAAHLKQQHPVGIPVVAAPTGKYVIGATQRMAA